MVSGSARRVTTGHSTALMSASTPATRSAAPNESVSTPGRSAVRATSSRLSTASSTTARTTNPRTRREPLTRCRAARPSIAHTLVASFSGMVHGAVSAHRAGTSPDRIVFLGHATVLIELDGVRLLTDPLLRARVAHLRRQAPLLDPSDTAGLDAVLISHMHHDHLDLASLRLLGHAMPLLVPPA